MQVETLKSKIKREEQRYQLLFQSIIDTEAQISEKERQLTRKAEEMDLSNHRVMREQKNQREKRERIEKVKQNLSEMERQIEEMRKLMKKRRDTINIKEIQMIEK